MSSEVLKEIRVEAARTGVVIEEVSPDEVHALAPKGTTQGVAAQVVHRQLTDIEDLLAAQHEAVPFYLVLDQIQDPHNFGALLRTANAAGVQAVIVPERRSAPAIGVVAKTSAGAISHTATIRVSNLVRTLDRLRGRHIWTVGLDGEAPISVFDADLTVPLALVVGGEESGLRRLTREHSDLLVHIPMFGQVESLNASVAGAIVMYEVVRQRELHSH